MFKIIFMVGLTLFFIYIKCFIFKFVLPILCFRYNMHKYVLDLKSLKLLVRKYNVQSEHVTISRYL